ncbi:hypothetical protein SDC9_113466 [bioreactor metagenome]|uniref:Uncharacterized protein n=1 Tax=bioreactor metagenome TaxID=1076179 RepID=A0A645BMU0_9ZZZZ
MRAAVLCIGAGANTKCGSRGAPNSVYSAGAGGAYCQTVLFVGWRRWQGVSDQRDARTPGYHAPHGGFERFYERGKAAGTDQRISVADGEGVLTGGLNFR